MPHYALEGARANLTAADEIIALMAQDLNDLRREVGHVTHANLLEKGWTKPQLNAFFQRALEEAFRTFCETRAPAHEAEQAAPFLTFDADMRRQLARRETFSTAPVLASDDANEVA